MSENEDRASIDDPHAGFDEYENLMTAALIALLKRYMIQRRAVLPVPTEEHVLTFSPDELLETCSVVLVLTSDSEGGICIRLTEAEHEEQEPSV